ncbi:hypothetical protein LC55x_1722 [Lysobacter capsici]|nr:hypothetical protein LC55x_1722 [Lysobacter capsici]
MGARRRAGRAGASRLGRADAGDAGRRLAPGPGSGRRPLSGVLGGSAKVDDVPDRTTRPGGVLATPVGAARAATAFLQVAAQPRGRGRGLRRSYR